MPVKKRNQKEKIRPHKGHQIEYNLTLACSRKEQKQRSDSQGSRNVEIVSWVEKVRSKHTAYQNGPQSGGELRYKNAIGAIDGNTLFCTESEEETDSRLVTTYLK